MESPFSGEGTAFIPTFVLGVAQMSERRRVNHIGYVLLSHGAKHTSVPLAERPGAVTQMGSIERMVWSLGGDIVSWRVDHARAPRGSRSFPSLFAALDLAKEHEANGLIVIDDTSRLLGRLSTDAQQEMVAALEPYHRYIVDARRRKLLSQLKRPEWMAMMITAITQYSAVPRASKEKRQDGSRGLESARRISSLSRSRSADRLARAIFDLREELVVDGKAPSHVDLARVANERGLRTSRAKRWSDVAVARAIRRIEKAARKS